MADEDEDDPTQGIPVSSETKRYPLDESERGKFRKDDDDRRDDDD